MSKHNQIQPFGSEEQAASPSETETPAAGPPPPAQPPEAASQGEQDASRTNRASHSYGGEGQGGGEEGEGQKKNPIKILRLGVDGLVLSYEGEISPDLDYDLMERKNLAQSPFKDEQARAQWPVKGHIFEVSHRGQKPFAYILEDKAFRICLASSGSKSVPLAYVKISSELLAHKGPEAAADELAGIVAEFGEAGVYPMPSRVDLCAHFQTDVNMEGFTRQAWVTRAGAIDAYSRQGNFTGWTIGKGGPISARLYNKSLEIAQKSGKTFFIDLWKRAGMDPDRPVWRLEFQFMREVLNELGIRSFEGLMRELGGLWGYATQTWLRLAVEQQEDSNRARWATHAMWEQLAAILWRLDDVPLVRKFSPARVPAADKLYRLYMSILTSFIASDQDRTGISDEDKAKGYADGVGPATINRELDLLSAAINYARKRWEWDIQNPVSGMSLRLPEGRLRWISRAEADVLIREAEKDRKSLHLADFIRLALNTGCRKNEMLKLSWDRVDLKANVLRLEGIHTKSGKRRAVPLDEEARRALLNRARFRAEHCPNSLWVFAHKSGERIQFMQNGFQAACGRAGIMDFRVHDMRHTCASWLVQGGVPLLEVSKLLGHSTTEMTERYAHLAPENLKAAVGVLDRLRSGYATGSEAVRAIG